MERKVVRGGGRDLSDIVLSWSLQEVLDDQLCEEQVEKIPNEFLSIGHYLNSYVAPLIEETRSDLCSSLELIMEAPYSKIICMEEVGGSGLSYYMDVDFWDNGAGCSTETYMARNGDIFILSSMKPESAEEFNRYGVVTYCLAMVTEVSMDEDYQKGFRVKVSKDISAEDNLNKFRYAIFLTNIMSNLRIWKALCFDTVINNNFTIIKSILAPRNMADGSCGICLGQSEDCLTSFTEQLLSINLNQSQVDAVESVISAVQCKHSNLMKLIWGPPGTGKTKTVSALLWALRHLKCRTLTCAPTNVAVVGVCSRLLQVLKDFNEHGDMNGLPCSLGDILLFGSKDKMDITDDLQEIFLDYRVDELVGCFSSLSGWRYRINSMIALLEDSGSRYDMLLEDGESGDPVCFLDFLKKQFDVVAVALENCIIKLCIHLPKRHFSDNNASKIFTLLGLLKKFDGLLSHIDLSDENVKRAFGLLSTEDSVCVKARYFIEKELTETRVKCLQLLKALQSSLNLPHGVDRNWIQNYCMQNSTLLFCTASSSYRLHHVETAPLDVLIVDEAAQLRECELVIPLRLHWLKHVVLVGDDCQLRSMVRSQVCKEAGFGVSLFERLVLLGFEKHLLNMQYRMNPCISFFPNAQFYARKILDGPNVKSPSYNKDYSDLPFGSYTFVNIADGREEKDGTGNSQRNMVEVAVVLHLVQTIFKSWKNTGRRITIGVVSPYSSQVNAIKGKLGTEYDTCDGFDVRVKSIDGFQGEEDDVIILSTVRSNSKGAVGFLADNQRTNVALTRARHCLWILGNANTLSKSGTIWADLVVDAQQRNCLFNATDDVVLSKLVLQVKHELDELDDLLNPDSALFSNTRWKVIFSDKFRKSFTKLKSSQLKREVIQRLGRLGSGWRTRVKNLDMADAFQLARVYKVRDLYLVWSTDIEKNEKFFQIIRIWDLLPLQHIERTVKRLENLFSMYTDDYLDHCRTVQIKGKVEVPMSWEIGHAVVRYKKDCRVDAPEEDHDRVDTSYAMENSKVSESFLLMKFYSLSSGVAKHLLTASDGSEIDIPFELNDQEEEIIRFPLSSFILGRSGTGKTTILTMKLIQKEQQFSVASQGLNFEEIDLSGADGDNFIPQEDVEPTEGSFLKQVFITVSSKLCSAIKNQICRLERFATGDLSDQPSSVDMHDIDDELDEFVDIPDNFSDLPRRHYPLVITFRKFLMMLDGTLQNSFFDKFYGEWGASSERGHSKSRALQAFIELKEVDYVKFVSSYWPHFNAELTKKLDASTVFTQIISHIKGGYQASKSRDGKLQRQEYIMLCDKRFSSLSTEMRERVYDIFLDYENKKCTAREFDFSDFVNSLHYNIGSEGYNGDVVDVVYIDEVQDLTMSQIALLKYVCRNFKEGFIFAGDTAQTIARGIDFRFEDICSLFYTEFLSELEGWNQDKKHGKEIRVTNMFQLSQNFRTHCGVLSLAQSIMSLLYYFFPSCVDKLNPETSLVYGEAPVLLESGNDENAIITIFGESKSKHGSLHGFGAEQVILVRDDAAKKQIRDLVGKQALVLTIVECKGLEFQDVLLYNFFSSSPLRNKWRVVYEYMKNKDILSSCKEISHPDFDKTKHYLLCSELKQLYVAITRTRQRLWICENTDDYCQPMFDYWKKLCLVQVRLLDSSLVQAMQMASSTDDWKLRGIKLFNEGQFEMATMCFEKAGDAHREKWARAAGLVATAEHVISTNLEMGQASLNKAAEIYESICKHEKAATCYIKLRDFRKAGMIYLEKCGTSRLEDAGDCFAMTECWSLAADAYFKAKCYTKCFSMCSKGKLFDVGLQFLQQLKEESFLEEPNSLELVAIRSKYLEDCAVYYFVHGDIKHMMSFVKAFNSMDHVRTFLNSRNLLDELLNVEVEMGNFFEAAEIAKIKGNILLEVDMLEKAGSFENATRLILLHVIMNSLWASGSRGWPPKKFAQKEQLLTKAKEIAKKVSDCFYSSICLGADVLSDTLKSLANLSKHLLEFGKCGNILFELFAAHSILDIHLLSGPSGYISELEPGSEVERQPHDMLTHNQISAETLLCFWNHWKSIILKVLSYLRHPEDSETDASAAVCRDLCAEYFGLRKDGDNDLYIVLNTDSSWLSNTGRGSLQQDGNRCWLNALQFHSCAQNYWSNELYSVGLSVLEKLESLIGFSPKQVSSPYAHARTVLAIYEVAKFLKESEFSIPRNITKLRRFFALSENCFLNIVFPLDWKDETADSVLYIHDAPAAKDLLDDSLNGNLKPGNGKLTHGQLGRIAILLLLTGRLDDTLISRVMQCLDETSEWAEFFQALKTFLDYGIDRALLVLKFRSALEVTFTANWRYEKDYISPICYVYLLECLAFLASSCHVLHGCMFCTKSLLSEMLKCRGSKGYLDTCLASNPDLEMDGAALKSWGFIVHSLESLLSNKYAIKQWVQKASIPTSSYGPILLKLVVTLYLVTLTARQQDPYEVAYFLSRHKILDDLPWEFSQKIRHAMCLQSRTLGNFIKVFADAMAAIGNRLVVMGSPKGRPIFRDLNAYVISSAELRDVEKVRALLFPRRPRNMQQESPQKAQSKCDGSKIQEDSSENVPSASEAKDEPKRTSEAGFNERNRVFWEKFEAFRADKEGQGDARVTVDFLNSVLSWLEQRGPLKDLDAQWMQEMRSVCDQFKQLSVREEKNLGPTIKDLYSKWQDGGNKLQMIMRLLASERDSITEAAKESGGASVKMPESQPDTGSNTAKATEEEATEACSTSKTKPNKPKKSKKSGNSKHKGKK